MRRIWQAIVAVWSVLYRVWILSGHVHLGLIAAGVAFFGMFSIFPAIAAMIALFGLLADPSQVEAQMVLLDDFIPGDAYTLVQSQFERLRSAQTETLGVATVISVMVALWSARAGVSALIQGLNAIHRRPNRHGVIHAIQSIIMTIVLIVIAITAVLTVIVVPVILSLVNLPTTTGWMLEGLRWVVSLAVLMTALSLFYRFGPNRVRFGSGMVTPGAALVIVFWLGSSAGFSYYLTNFGNYNEVYGSIGAVIAMLTWLYISAYLVLTGAVLNVVLDGTDKLLLEKSPHYHEDSPVFGELGN